MKILLLTHDDSPNRSCKEPFPGAKYALAEGRCPKCDITGLIEKSFAVAGHGKRPSADDRAWEADASCLACNQHVGVLRIETNTLFGVREDERVSRLGIRIY